MRRDYQTKMIRLVVLEAGVVLADCRASSGRGGYVHPDTVCLERFERSRIKEFRSLRRRLGSDERRVITELVRRRLASEPGVE